MLAALALLWVSLAQASGPVPDGLKALDERDYATAAQLFAKAVEADPADFAARFHLALADSLLGREAEAAAGYRKVLELKPGLYEAEVNLGVLLLGQKQPAAAVPLLEDAVRQKPSEFRPVFYLAQALFAAGDFAKAEPRYLDALKLDAGSVPALLGLARSRARLGRLEEAAPDYRRAASLDPDLKDIELELASQFEAAGRPEKALEIYVLFPADPAALERRAVLSIRAGRPGEAAPLLEQLLAKEPGNLGLRLTYGRVLRELKKYAPASAEFVRALESKPDFVEAWSELAATLVLLEDYPRTLSALDRLRALGAELPGHLYLRAIVLDKTKQPEAALAAYEKFLSLSQGRSPDEEFLARQRARILKKEIDRK